MRGAWPSGRQYQIVEPVQVLVTGVTPVAAVSIATQPLTASQYYRLVKVTAQALPLSVNVPRFKLYKGDVQPSQMVEGSLNGNLYASQTLDILLAPREFLTFQWIAIDAGVVCTGVAIYEPLMEV